MTKIDTTRLPKLIGLCGLEGAGKIETAKCLRVAYGYTIQWRSACALPVQAIDTATRKAQSIARASDLWPEFAASFAGRDGRAEAALMARWCLFKGAGGAG